MTHKTGTTQASHYDQRRSKDEHHDESKRRKMIRWIKKTMGITEDPVELRRTHHPLTPAERASLSQSNHSHHSHHDQHGHHDHHGHGHHDHGHKHPTDTTLSRKCSHDSSTGSSSNGYDAPVYYQTASSSASGSYRSGSGVSNASIYEYHHQMPMYRTPSDTHRHSNTPHVIIIGGGIGGLCLAQGLKKHGIAFTVFERDPTPNYRTQGYRLRINSSGYEALKANLSRENFEVFLRSTGHFLPGFMYVDAHSGGAAPPSVKYIHKSSVTQHVFSTDRAMLRSLLLTDLQEGMEIQYGMAFRRYHMLPNGHYEVQFENGKTVEGTVVVGADGTTSRVRRQYIPRNVTLLDTDSGAIYGKTPITPDIEAYFATGSTTLVLSQDPPMSLVIEPRCATKVNLTDYIAHTGGMRNAANAELPDLHNYLCWVLIARAEFFHTRDDMTVQDLYAMAPEEVADLAKEMTSSWCPRIRSLFEKQAPEWCSFLRISTMAPDIKLWQPSMVTLLGDAVHTMTPAGIGCNTALHDSRILVKNFREIGVSIDAIAQYERTMREAGRAGITVSLEAGKRMYNLPDVKDMRVVVY